MMQPADDPFPFANDTYFSVGYFDSFGPDVICPRYITDRWNWSSEVTVVDAVTITCLDGKKNKRGERLQACD